MQVHVKLGNGVAVVDLGDFAGEVAMGQGGKQ